MWSRILNTARNAGTISPRKTNTHTKMAKDTEAKEEDFEEFESDEDDDLQDSGADLDY